MNHLPIFKAVGINFVFSADLPYLVILCLEYNSRTGDFVRKVKQINNQSDLIWMSNLPHFNLRSLYFQSLKSPQNFMQL